MIAQDVGSAIKGPERGDIYFGSGNEAGKLAGVLCLEHTGSPRLWSRDEQLFAISVADLLSPTTVFELVEAFCGLCTGVQAEQRGRADAGDQRQDRSCRGFHDGLLWSNRVVKRKTSRLQTSIQRPQLVQCSERITGPTPLAAPFSAGRITFGSGQTW